MTGVFSTGEAYRVYQCYLALKQHFTSDSYDYFKYGGKVSASVDSFERRKDKYQFYKLSKHKDWQNVLLANFVHRDKKTYIFDIVSSEGEHIYSEWLKRQQSLSYTFGNDLKDGFEENFDENLKVHNGQHPRLLDLYIQGKVCLETMVILQDLVNYIPYWDAKIASHILWNDIRCNIQKYKPFLHYDKAKMKQTVLNHFASG